MLSYVKLCKVTIMKQYYTYQEVKAFLDWLTLQPKKIQKNIEFELSFTNPDTRHPTIVTFFTNDDHLDIDDLYSAYCRRTPIQD